MSKQVHAVYIAILVFLGVGTTIVVGVNGFEYYSTPEKKLSNLKADLDAKISDRQVELEMMQQGLGSGGKTEAELKRDIASIQEEATYYNDWKPTGRIGHGIGILGSTMLISGVAMYSSRKRVRAMRQWGKLKHWLEFHIFLCLLGPTLVLYHTTFKFGGIVSVSFWSMVAVVLSGIIGRYIYTQIPRGISGNELTIDDLKKENDNFERTLREQFGADDKTIAMIDHVSRVDLDSEKPKDFSALLTVVKNDLTRRARLHSVRKHLQVVHIPPHHIHGIYTIAKKKSMLIRRIAFLETARRLFHYWHVVHQPFSIIMFVILAVHVIVTVSLGYTWMF